MKLNRPLKFILLVTASTALLWSHASCATEPPLSSNFYYCANFYNWVVNQAEVDSALQRHAIASRQLLYSSGTIIDGADVDKRELGIGRSFFQSKIAAAKQNNKPISDFINIEDIACQTLQRDNTEKIMKRAAEIGEAHKSTFSHNLQLGHASPDDISSREESMKTQPKVKIGSGNDYVSYSFSRIVGGDTETVSHIFTKPNHNAHPAVVFVSATSNRQGRQEKPVIQGSYAGDKKAFYEWKNAIYMMNTFGTLAR